MTTDTSHPPGLAGILETALYVDELEPSAAFYGNIMGLPELYRDDRLIAYAVAGKSVLLLFLRGASTHPMPLPNGGGTIPPHDGAGPVHFAMAIGRDDLATWEAHFAAHAIEIEGRTHWARGGDSLYVRDPGGHLLELATPGIWPIY